MSQLKLTPTTAEDVSQIREWILADPWHSTDSRHSAEWLLTGKGLLAFCLTDDKGPLCFVRLDAEDDMTRLAIQFGPESEVSKRRLITGLVKMGIPAIAKFSKERGFKGVVFESINPTLIAFGERQGFFKTAVENDYALIFGERNDV